MRRAVVHLKANAVDRDVALDHVADHLVDRIRLVVHGLCAEVVVVELGVRIRVPGRRKRLVDIGGAEIAEEDGVA